MTQDLRLDLSAGALARLTLARPQKLNALTWSMLSAIDAALARIEGDPAVRCVLVEGEGERAFCAGADIAEWAERSPLEMWRRWIAEGNRVFDRLAALPVPVVAVIDGLALGGGLELALAADLRICTRRSRLGLPETGIATIPGWGGERRLVELIGPARAKQMVFLGELVDGPAALDWGAVNWCVEPDELAAKVAEIADGLAARGPVAVQASKVLLNQAAGAAAAAGLRGLASAVCTFTADGQEGVAAFLEKRAPKFRGS